jgi:CheY-like chemotaxis protein/thiamine kinase-like enzyme
MDRQGRILIIDNLEQWRNALVEILREGDYLADSASTISEALKLLNENFYHLLVADIRMEETDGSNIDGMDLLCELDKRGLDEATKVIILSAYGTEEQMRTAFRDYKVADFISKDKFNKHIFLESVRRAFSEEVDINLELEILSQPRSRLEQIVLTLLVGGSSVKRGTSLFTQLTAELDDLFCRLFHEAKGILVRPLITGYSGVGVLRIQPFYQNKGMGRELIVKFGDVQQIEEEYKNFKEFVEPFLGSGRNTTILDMRRTTHLAGILYSLLGTSSDELTDFGEFYRQADLSQINKALEHLFLSTCGAWYANHDYPQPLNLTEDYQQLFGYTQKELEQILSRRLKSVRRNRKLTFDSLNSERTFTNPLLAIDSIALTRPTYTSTTHGDFNPHNLLVDSTGHVWLIDFQETGKGHILRDVATLDSVVRFQLLAVQEATLAERLLMEEALCSIEHFSQVKDLATRFSTANLMLAKIYDTVIHLRSLASRLVERNPNDDMSEYYIALLYSALNTMRFSSLQQVQREHALLSASLLVDRLGLDSK